MTLVRIRLRVEFNVDIIKFRVLKEEDRKIIRTVLELIVLKLMDNTIRRFISIQIKRIRECRKEFQTDSIRTKVVGVRGQLDCSLKELKSTLMFNRV